MRKYKISAFLLSLLLVMGQFVPFVNNGNQNGTNNLEVRAEEEPETPQPGSVVIKALDNASNPVVGAVVELSGDGFSTGRQATTDEFGNAVFTEVLPGDYEARLALVPEGYEYNAYVEKVTVVSHEISEGMIFVDKVQEPETPEEPEQPEKPETPEKPEEPETPEKPGEPETPGEDPKPSETTKPSESKKDDSDLTKTGQSENLLFVGLASLVVAGYLVAKRREDLN